MSTLIRRPAQHDRIMNSRREDSLHFEQYDRSYVMEKYPHLDGTIIDRLGAAISRRRRDLKYRERHQKLSRGLAATASDRADDQTVAVSSTVATEFHSSQAEINDAASDTNVTQTSVAPSLFDPKQGITIPNPPKGSEDGAFFQCPYCYIIVSIEDRRDWARHIFMDILPYVCVFADCPLPNQLYGQRREWSRHIRDCHISLINVTEPSKKCPFCKEHIDQMAAPKAERHIGRHLEDLALFAVPRDDDEDQLEEEEAERKNIDYELWRLENVGDNWNIAIRRILPAPQKELAKKAKNGKSKNGRVLEQMQTMAETRLEQIHDLVETKYRETGFSWNPAYIEEVKVGINGISGKKYVRVFDVIVARVRITESSRASLARARTNSVSIPKVERAILSNKSSNKDNYESDKGYKGGKKDKDKDGGFGKQNKEYTDPDPDPFGISKLFANSGKPLDPDGGIPIDQVHLPPHIEEDEPIGRRLEKKRSDSRGGENHHDGDDQT